MKFSGTVGNGPLNKLLNFDGDPDHCLNTGIVFQIRHYWEIRKVSAMFFSLGFVCLFVNRITQHRKFFESIFVNFAV